jgi:hypothetical protein
MAVSKFTSSSGINDFNINVQSTYSTVTLTQEYPIGAYSFTSSLNDTTMDLYFYNGVGTLVGYTNTKGVIVTGGFNKVVIIGGTTGDVLSFTYKTTYNSVAETAELTAGPVVLSTTPLTLPGINSTTTVTGLNFATDVAVTFKGTDNLVRNAKNVIRGSVNSLIVTRPDLMPAEYSSYTMTVTNPSVAYQPTGSNSNTISVSAGSAPVWVTAASLGNISSLTMQATDADGAVVYSTVSGTPPSSYDANTGVYSVFGFGTFTWTIRATDVGGNYADRTFTATTASSAIGFSTGGTTSVAGGYRYHTFSTSGSYTFTPSASASVEVIMWGAGGAAGGTGSTTFCYGGGGAYAKSTLSVTAATPYSVAVGGGGQLGTQGCLIGSGGSGGTGFGSLYQGGAGTAAGTTPCSGTGGGGGGASVFLTNTGTALIVAGGGGGAGGTESAENGTGKGGGGGQNGLAGNASGSTGGSAGSSGSTNGAAGSMANGDHSGAGGGGGGVAGGGGGYASNVDGVSQGGGGGGSSLGTTVTNGNYQTPGNNTDSLYIAGTGTGGNTGQNGGNGLVIVRYAI